MLFGFPIADLAIFVGISLFICITVCTLAMEAAVLFVPAFLFLFPRMIEGFPQITPNEAIGLAITVEFFGYTSSVLGYWFRNQVDVRLGLRILAITVPLAIIARIAAFFNTGARTVDCLRCRFVGTGRDFVPRLSRRYPPYVSVVRRFDCRHADGR